MLWGGCLSCNGQRWTPGCKKQLGAHLTVGTADRCTSDDEASAGLGASARARVLMRAAGLLQHLAPGGDVGSAA